MQLNVSALRELGHQGEYVMPARSNYAFVLQTSSEIRQLAKHFRGLPYFAGLRSSVPGFWGLVLVPVIPRIEHTVKTKSVRTSEVHSEFAEVAQSCLVLRDQTPVRYALL